MSKPFDYSKWDNIELSDDEEDCHPNIDKESWFRMKHRSRVEREENEAKDKAVIVAAMEQANQRMKVLEHDLRKISLSKNKDDNDSDDDDDDDDIDDTAGLQAELTELQRLNGERQAKLDEYEKNKKWHIDNMFQVKEERTIVNPTAGKVDYDAKSGFALQDKDELKVVEENKTKDEKKDATVDSQKKPAAAAATKVVNVHAEIAKAQKQQKKEPAGPSPPPPPSTTAMTPAVVADDDVGVMETYPEFVEKYASLVEEFMALPNLQASEEFLLRHGQVLLQENASNYLLLASLEDEMNGHSDKMRRTARQSQIISHIAELAKTVGTHPGNVVKPFFQRLTQRSHLEEFLQAVNEFCLKIEKRAVVKKREIDQARAAASNGQEGTALQDMSREERLGPGGLDPMEVIETLPASVVEAFESRNVEDLEKALAALPPDEAQHHLQRCIDSGLWVAQK